MGNRFPEPRLGHHDSASDAMEHLLDPDLGHDENLCFKAQQRAGKCRSIRGAAHYRAIDLLRPRRADEQ